MRGEVPARRIVAQLLNPLFPDQLSLIPPPPTSMARSSQKDLQAEVTRIDELLRTLRCPIDDPKKRLLRRLVAHQRGRKIVVFCACIDTAHALAGYLGWDRVGLVTGRGAHIASGPLGTSTLLSLFAPSAQRNPNRVHAREEITVLIATDMLSEGVNLQDAEVVVHYDLPWTPLRLQQRIGRIARLHSPHRVIRVEWFAPPADLGVVLPIGPILERKSTVQDTLGVAVTTRPGRARVISHAWAAREKNLERISAPWQAGNAGPVHAVVSHCREAVVALRFTWEHGSLDVVYATDITSGALTDSIERVGRVMSRLRECRACHRLPPPSLLQQVNQVAGTWLSQSMLARGGAATDTLIRRTLDLARASAHRRNGRFVMVLNRTLDRAINGLRAGAEGELHDCLGRAPSESCLHSWLARWPSRPVGVPSVQVLAALIGVGGEPAVHDGSSSTTPESSRSS